jgi:selenide,water dikinase
LPKIENSKVLVGTETSDDAGVYWLNETTALVQTVDFFTPVVDDPYTFGQIAAANSLSDVYAMGGTPITALNIVGFPFCTLPGTVLAKILQGGQAKAAEAGVVILGGHTIQDKEPKYGLAVTGIVAPNEVYTNAQARVGDYLVLTKPIGTGVITTAQKAGLASSQSMTEVISSMTTLNQAAAKAMQAVGCHSCTDITGFGLIGHAYEMAAGSKVCIELYAGAVPLFTGAKEYAAMGLIPAGAYANREAMAAHVRQVDQLPEVLLDLFYDPQTSGGLLIAVAEAKLDRLRSMLEANCTFPHAVIGRVVSAGQGQIIIRDSKGL